MKTKFFDNDLFILDLANNHFGDVEHAKKVIRQVASVVKSEGVRAAIKLQLRDLDSFVHESMRESDHRYVRRFLDTRLTDKDFADIADLVRKENLILMATPFDEPSLEAMKELGVSVSKIASASANDLPLVRAITETKLPIVASTGGLNQFEIDALYSSLLASGNEFALMHCVSIYPSPSEKLQLLQIANFRSRYPGTAIGWSTHEDPESLDPVVIAKSLGASLFERHVGIKSTKYGLNGYSSTPQQLKGWLRKYSQAVEMLGSQLRLPASTEETESLASLARGYYASSDVAAGEQIQLAAQAAFPVVHTDQIRTSDDLESMHALKEVRKGAPILRTDLAKSTDESHGNEVTINKILFEVRARLSEAGISLNQEARIELSHHYGIDRFREFGATLITVLNREYAKKIVVMLARQKHPSHRHLKKEETFQLLWGDLELTVNGRNVRMKPGDVYTVLRGDWHKFQSSYGAVIEEISSHAFDADSNYEDKSIDTQSNRKTQILNWHNHFVTGATQGAA